MRLNRYIAHCGVCSRRKADVLIQSEAVCINDEVVTTPGRVVGDGDIVTYRGRRIAPETLIYLILNKPTGVVTSMDDEYGRRTVHDLCASACDERVYPVGRLDRDTTGVLVMTNDGALAHRLSHPRFEVSKTYRVSVDRPLTSQVYRALLNGIVLEDGLVRCDHVRFFAENTRLCELVLHSGKNRVIRRMFAACGYTVVYLDRVAYAGISYQGISRGRWRHMEMQEVQHMQNGKVANK